MKELPSLAESSPPPSATSWLRISIVGVYAAALLCLTHANLKGTLLDQSDYPDQFSMLDKVFHYGSYGMLTYLGLRLFEVSTLRNAIAWSLLVACFGGFDEITQPYFGRCCDVLDWLANVLGIATANVVFFRWQMTQRRIFHADGFSSVNA